MLRGVKLFGGGQTGIAAVARTAKPLDPSVFNTSALKPALQDRIHVPVPIDGVTPAAPPGKEGNIFGYVAKPENDQPLSPSAYNTSALAPAPIDQITVPVPSPYTVQKADEELRAKTEEGEDMKQPTDYLALAKTMVKSARTPADQYYWSNVTRSLAQFNIIKASRPLSAQEQERYEDLIKDIEEVTQGRRALPPPPPGIPAPGPGRQPQPPGPQTPRRIIGGPPARKTKFTADDYKNLAPREQDALRNTLYTTFGNRSQDANITGKSKIISGPTGLIGWSSALKAMQRNRSLVLDISKGTLS